MTAKMIFAATGLVLSMSAGWAFAGEGNGDPFPFQAESYVTIRPASMADTGSGAYPQQTGNSVQPSSLAQLRPAPGSEALLQTALSLPRDAGTATAVRAQTQGVHPHVAGRSERGRHMEIGEARPRG